MGRWHVSSARIWNPSAARGDPERWLRTTVLQERPLAEPLANGDITSGRNRF